MAEGPEPAYPASAAERARLEETEERRAAERAAALATQRAAAGEVLVDSYVARRVAEEHKARAALDREAIEAVEQQAGGSLAYPWAAYLAIGLLLAGLLLAFITYLNQQPGG